MSSNVNVKNYLKNISSYQHKDENPLDAIKNNPSLFKQILLDIQKDMSKREDSFNSPSSVVELVDSIFKIDIVLRTCNYIESVAAIISIRVSF